MCQLLFLKIEIDVWDFFVPVWHSLTVEYSLASRFCWNRVSPWYASELVSFLIGLRTYQHPGNFMECIPCCIAQWRGKNVTFLADTTSSELRATCFGLINLSITRPLYEINSKNKLMTRQSEHICSVLPRGITHYNSYYNKISNSNSSLWGFGASINFEWVYLITHTNTCTHTHTHTHTYYLRSLKFTLKRLKRSYMFRSHDHPQGAYIVPG